jgi:4,5-DOPA dioxygenase extradiol
VLDLLALAGVQAQADATRPLDHGAWVPLMHLFPDASVPVVQVALPAHAGPHDVYAMGQALTRLRAQGVLLIGSGSMTHNLLELFCIERGLHDAPAAYVGVFARWIETTLMRGDLAALLNYRAQAPDFAHAHPSDEHFLPLFFALGAGGWGQPPATQVDYLSREVLYGTLAMDTFSIG